MQIIEVIPLTTLPPQVSQLLSYYHNEPLQKGAIVEILIGNRKTPAVVASSSSLEGQKASLKSSAFQLKKISGIVSETPLVSDIQFKLALWLSRTYFAPLGLCLKTVMPSFFIKKNLGPTNHNQHIINKSASPDSKPLILLTRAKDIIKNIESEIKKTISLKKQVLLIVPEISIIKYFYEKLAGSYEVTVINSKLSQKQIHKYFTEISSGEAEIIIGTRQALFSPFRDLGLIILEDPSNEAYKSDMSPKYNTADLAIKVAEIYSARMISVSRISDIKNYYLSQKGLNDIKDKTRPGNFKLKIIDMVQEVKTGRYSVLSRELTERIKDCIEKGKKILIFSSRKGYSGSLLCENCGFSPKCPDCSVPFRLQGLAEVNLICFRCSLIQKTPDHCPDCQSYKLKAKGFPGSQKIEEELKYILEFTARKPEIFILDRSLIKNDKAEEEVLNKMGDSSSYICIATQMIFSHRYTNCFDLIGIPNVDGLTIMPDFRSEVELFGQFQKLADFEPQEIIAQSYNSDNKIFSILIGGNFKEFYDDQLQLRKLFSYPPLARLIKLSFRHPDRAKAIYESRLLGEKLKLAIGQKKIDGLKLLGPMPGFIEKEKGFYIYNIILKIAPQQKPEEILKFVPSHWMIDVDPKSIL